MRDDIFTDGEDGVRTFDVSKIFGRGYSNGLFFNFKGRYRFFMGSRSSKKSQNMLGYEPILKILSDPRRNIVMCRQNDVDNKLSTYANLIKCIEDLGLTDEFSCRKQPLEIEYKRTGQMIVFKGLNNPTSITSTKFPHGELTDIYIEEAFECQSYDDFLKLDGSLRLPASVAKDISIQITCVMNPWAPDHWIYTEFFRGRLDPDAEYMETHTYDDYRDDSFVGPFGKGLYLHQSNYKINEFRDRDTWDAAAENMKSRAPELYKPNFLGLFGAVTGLAYPEFSTACQITSQEAVSYDYADFAIGIDTGLSDGQGKKRLAKRGEDPERTVRSATTMSLVGITRGFDKIVVIDEYFHSNSQSDNQTNTDGRESLTHAQLVGRLVRKIAEWQAKYGVRGRSGALMKGTIRCYVDSADQGTIDDLIMEARRQGLFSAEFMGSTKLSIQTRIDFERLMMAYGCFLINGETCGNGVREYRTARKGDRGEPRVPGNDHFIDATNYAWAPFRNEIILWKTQFKEH